MTTGTQRYTQRSYSEGDTFEVSEGVKEECWETDILPSIYRYMSHAAVALWLKTEELPH